MNKISCKINNIVFLCYYFFLCNFILVSCDGTQNEFRILEETDTAKYATISRDVACSWIDETDTVYLNVACESNETSEKIIDSAQNDVFTKYLKKEETEVPKIYPSILGFGSLDSSTIPDQLYRQVESFIRCINSGDFSKVKVSNQKEYLRALAEYRMQNCKPVTKSYVGKMESISIDIDTSTSNILQKVPVLIETPSQKFIVVLFYKQFDIKDWAFDYFEVYDE